MCGKKKPRDPGKKLISDREPVKKTCLHAIRGDEGKHFKVTENTKICSQHFRKGDITNVSWAKMNQEMELSLYVFSWIRTSPRKGKEPAERNCELTASKSASRKFFTPAVVLEELSNESSNELSNEMVPDLPDCSLKVEDETQTGFTDQEAYLREIIDNNNKKIHSLEQEIEELKRQLQDMQRQRDALNKRLFNFENCKSKDSNAALYTGFQSWDTLMAVFEYLDHFLLAVKN